MSNHDVILHVEKLSKSFVVKKNVLSKSHVIKAVNQVNLDVFRGETLGLIGESGSGKTTLSHLIMGLTSHDSGQIKFNGIEDELFRKEVQIVFQYTYGALDPLKTVYELILEPLKLHHITYEGAPRDEVKRLLNQVGLPDVIMNRKTGEISGGQKQRVGIARAIASRPKFIVLDEPVSALDISVQGQIVNLLNELKVSLGLTYLFITHDLKIAKHLSDRIAVMYKGEIVEVEETQKIIEHPKHPYTKILLESL